MRKVYPVSLPRRFTSQSVVIKGRQDLCTHCTGTPREAVECKATSNTVPTISAIRWDVVSHIIATIDVLEFRHCGESVASNKLIAIRAAVYGSGYTLPAYGATDNAGLVGLHDCGLHMGGPRIAAIQHHLDSRIGLNTQTKKHASRFSVTTNRS